MRTPTDSRHTRQLRCMLLTGPEDRVNPQVIEWLRDKNTFSETLQFILAVLPKTFLWLWLLSYCILNCFQPLHRPVLIAKSSVTLGGSTQTHRHTMPAIFSPSLISIPHQLFHMTAAACSAIPGRSSGKHERPNIRFVQIFVLLIPAREQMSPFYFKFQFRNVEYSSGRNKTLLCFRVDTPGGAAEPLKGYMEDEHATAHAEEAFFQQVTCWHSCAR